ncbi:MAG: HlyD family secretion protein [Bacteroidales bacterium]|jgi:HlyD family secretion protein|nr:HlyD family secretion protein [Bacteroidales bacterium]MDN5329581.1 HlyD family secretion protein [Bacteroidales bacterium]
MKKNKKILFIAGGILLLLLIVLAIKKKNNRDYIKVATETVQIRNIIETISATGKIQPVKDIKITPYISGEVIEIFVKEGDKVKAGDLLVRIDPEIYKSAYEQAEAQLNSQKANLANARAQLAQVEARFKNTETVFNRNKALWEKKVISDADFETAKTNYEIAKADLDAIKQSIKASEFAVNSAEAALRKSREDLNKTAVYAPADGRVSKLSVEKGERVMGASQFSAGTELMRIANLDNMQAVVDVNENDIVKVKLGDTSLIEVDAYLNRKFKGIVTEIATSASTSGVSIDQVTNFQVKIQVLRESYLDLISPDQPEYIPFRPGMSATVDIQTRRRNKVLSVPIQAVTTRQDSTGKVKRSESVSQENEEEKKAASTSESYKEYVFIYDNGYARMREVKSGIQDNNYIEIVSGLKEGEEVISAPYSAISRQLKNGDRVEKVPKDKLYEVK